MTNHPCIRYGGGVQTKRQKPSVQRSLDSCSYIIKVQGWLDERWSAWFDGASISYEGDRPRTGMTALRCPSVDQAQLRGMLNRIWDMNLSLISVWPTGAEGFGSGSAPEEPSASPRSEAMMEDHHGN